MKSFADKVAAITGAGSGMGRELALELGRRGCHLALSDVNEQGLAETEAAVSVFGVKVTTLRLDVADREAVYAWAAQTARDHGKVNLIFNNAGVALSSSLEAVAQSDFDWIMNINFWGVVWGSQAFLPHLKASGEGHIVNTSSLFGLMSVPGVGPYNASKFAVRGYTEALRMELDLERAPVSATCVHPGGIDTNIARASRISDNVGALLGTDPQKAKDDFQKLLKTTSPAQAARAILRGVERNARRVLVGPDAKFMDLVLRVLASLYQPLVVWSSRRLMKSRQV